MERIITLMIFVFLIVPSIIILSYSLFEEAFLAIKKIMEIIKNNNE